MISDYALHTFQFLRNHDLDPNLKLLSDRPEPISVPRVPIPLKVDYSVGDDNDCSSAL